MLYSFYAHACHYINLLHVTTSYTPNPHLNLSSIGIWTTNYSSSQLCRTNKINLVNWYKLNFLDGKQKENFIMSYGPFPTNHVKTFKLQQTETCL